MDISFVSWISSVKSIPLYAAEIVAAPCTTVWFASSLASLFNAHCLLTPSNASSASTPYEDTLLIASFILLIDSSGT